MQNLRNDPQIAPRGIFHRDNRTVVPATKKRAQVQLQREAQRSHLVHEAVLDFDPCDESDHQREGEGTHYPFPFPLEEEIKVLGVYFDCHFTFDGKFAHVLAKARTRQGILARVARFTWGSETSILQVAHDAVISRLVGYTLTKLGSSMPEDLVSKMDVQIPHTASRTIAYLPMTTKIQTLRFLTNTWSFRNLYIKHCAQFVH